MILLGVIGSLVLVGLPFIVAHEVGWKDPRPSKGTVLIIVPLFTSFDVIQFISTAHAFHDRVLFTLWATAEIIT